MFNFSYGSKSRLKIESININLMLTFKQSMTGLLFPDSSLLWTIDPNWITYRRRPLVIFAFVSPAQNASSIISELIFQSYQINFGLKGLKA